MSETRRRLRLRLAAGAASLMLLGEPASGVSRLEGLARDAGLGLGAAACTALYAPFKTFIGGSGIMVGGATWALTGGNTEPAMTIVERTLGGDWIVTQDHLRGRRDFAVLGPDRRDLARGR